MVNHLPLVFFLGGRDLEMTTVRELLETEGAAFFDHRLGWGAKASDYQEEIRQALDEGRVPVLVELQVDMDLPSGNIRVVDHHGQRAGATAPTSLRQVFDLLELPSDRWTRHMELVAVNDRAYLPGMKALGATTEEMREIRRLDREAQGVTSEEERGAEIAVSARRMLLGGRLTVVRCPHDRTATVTDRLHADLGGPGYVNLLVLGPNEWAFFGEGALVECLDRTYPGGWKGGDLPKAGFWGRKHVGCSERVLIDRLTEWLAT
jgi:hypothetical protein